MPQLSVIIPAYNAERWLPETLASVAAQEVDDMEVIIVDDGSTDNTAVYVESHWPQFKLVRTANRGVSHARNLGMTLATGELIQYLDADDVLLPGKVARQVEMLAARPDIDVVYCNWQRLTECEEGTFVTGEKVERTIAEVDPDPELAFFSAMWCPTGCYLYRRALLGRVGPWKDWLPVVQDARLAWDCARAGAQWLHDEQIGVLYRQHRSGSISTRSRQAFLKDCWMNTRDMERQWQNEGTLVGRRLSSVISSYDGLARGCYEFDKPLFEEVHARLLELDPAFLPPGKILPWLTRLLGYRNAEAVAFGFRRLKRMAKGNLHGPAQAIRAER